MVILDNLVPRDHQRVRVELPCPLFVELLEVPALERPAGGGEALEQTLHDLYGKAGGGVLVEWAFR